MSLKGLGILIGIILIAIVVNVVVEFASILLPWKAISIALGIVLLSVTAMAIRRSRTIQR